ncbi:enolase [Methanoregula boonei 6A8]|jgi:enolase|uniref:Enolase n=1 Tax=Methanoregula boonei (strain DSM 21154 / JCM 14090 / 6A8) TaxID=456442 RepID=A7I6T9_METB6|nr:enolase [Methanoregula boonei 6A8]
MDSSLQSIPAREFPDSRSNPAIEGEIMIRDTVRAVDPSGASTGKNQAVGFRDRLS